MAMLVKILTVFLEQVDHSCRTMRVHHTLCCTPCNSICPVSCFFFFLWPGFATEGLKTPALTHALFTRWPWRWLKVLTGKFGIYEPNTFCVGHLMDDSITFFKDSETLPHSFCGCQTVFHLPCGWWLYFKESCSPCQRQNLSAKRL